jgi:hypothetical protein
MRRWRSLGAGYRKAAADGLLLRSAAQQATASPEGREWADVATQLLKALFARNEPSAETCGVSLTSNLKIAVDKVAASPV